ncbi:glycosyltransferase [Streptomyces sp. NPDC059070]|uniref:glycosyltransferase n=1 Tax=unclassified Streptomyces TaxID=2593676 RepID=UPI0034E2149F
MSAPSPYRFVGRVATGDTHVDRPELARRIAEVLAGPGRPGNLSVLGHRRVGKTSLVARVVERADRDDLAVVRIDVDRHNSAIDLFQAIVAGVTARLPGIPELEPLCRVVLAAREWYDLDSAVVAFFQELGRQGHYALLVLDEFERAPRVMTDLNGFQLLRALASEAGFPVGLITVSRRPIIEIETDAAGGSILNGVLVARCHVGVFSPVEAARMMDRAKEAGVDLSAVAPELLERSGSHPYLLEVLCHRVVRTYEETGAIDVAAAHAAEAEEFRAHFARLVQAVDADTAGQGVDLLKAVAGGVEVPCSPALQLLLDLGVVIRNGGELRLFSKEFASFVRAVGEEPAVAPRTPGHRCTALVVATEWNSAHGGLSTFNRQLCLALAAQRVRVLCMVLDATDQEVAEADKAGVTLLRRRPTPGAPELSRLIRPPELADGVVPDLVIGHGRITGPAALMQAEDHFPGARKLHFVHMAPDEIEWHKLDRADDAGESAESRTKIEVALGRAADHLVAVGPRLHGRFLGYFAPHDDAPDPLRFDPGFDLLVPGKDGAGTRQRKVPGGTPLTVLLMGRVEDASLKGVDLAAGACGLVAQWRHEAGLRSVELVVRGIPAGGSARQLARLAEWAACDRLSIVPRPYTTDTDDLADDLRRSSLVVMPSRAEGFGLVGVEAIVAGTPVLVSEKSGLGELLRRELGTERAGHWVVPMSGDTARDTQTWARGIDRMLRASDKEFALAETLRKELARDRPWSRSADALLTELGL